MKANELMIGDWVAFRGRPYQYTAQDIATMAECEEKGIATDTTPIPLTSEILEKNFPTAGELAWWPVGDGLHCESHNTEDIMVSGVFRFVHQLQNALRLCGIDKSIEL